MYEEAALCGLMIAEALLTHGLDTQARAIVRDIADRSRHTLLEWRVIEAVSALEQEIVENVEPVQAVRNVYALIESTHSERTRL
jgi:hypothetical protein